MSRYIDADKLIAHLKDEIEGCTPPVGGRPSGKSIAYGTELGLKMALSYAETLPSADVAKVVRCGECIHRTSGKPSCQGRHKDWFCANGVRR